MRFNIIIFPFRKDFFDFTCGFKGKYGWFLFDIWVLNVTLRYWRNSKSGYSKLITKVGMNMNVKQGLTAYREKLHSGRIKLDSCSSHPSIREFKYKLDPQWWGYGDEDIARMFGFEYKIWESGGRKDDSLAGMNTDK